MRWSAYATRIVAICADWRIKHNDGSLRLSFTGLNSLDETAINDCHLMLQLERLNRNECQMSQDVRLKMIQYFDN